MQDINTTHVAAPTATVLPVDQENRYIVWALRPTAKHDGKLVFPGGKIELHLGQTARECALDEFGQEAGGLGATLRSLWLFAIKTDPHSDVRSVTLARATNKSGPDSDAQKQVTAHYGVCDSIYVGTVNGTPAPKDGEAQEFIKIDVREIECAPTPADSLFAAGHDLIALVYRLWLAGRPVELEDFEDLKALRANLPALLEQYEAPKS